MNLLISELQTNSHWLNRQWNGSAVLSLWLNVFGLVLQERLQVTYMLVLLDISALHATFTMYQLVSRLVCGRSATPLPNYFSLACKEWTPCLLLLTTMLAWMIRIYVLTTSTRSVSVINQKYLCIDIYVWTHDIYVYTYTDIRIEFASIRIHKNQLLVEYFGKMYYH